MPIQYKKFADIPQYTPSGTWECNYSLHEAIETVDRWAKDRGLIIDPDFQRQHVWTPVQQSRYIEFLLRGGQSGRVIYFNCPWWSHRAVKEGQGQFVLVDGKQRLQAIRRFINNEITAFGSRIGEYEDKPGWRHSVRLNVNDLGTRASVLQWYLDLNDGGTAHTNDELNNVRTLLNKERAQINARVAKSRAAYRAKRVKQ